MNILGLNRGDHNASACLVQDGKLRSFINLERLTRVKYDAGQIWECAKYCLDSAALTINQLDLIVQNSYCFELAEFDQLYRSVGIRDDAGFIREFGHVQTIPHHLAHAYCAMGLSPFDECAILIVDGLGQFGGDHTEAETGYYCNNLKLEKVFERAGVYPKRDGIHESGYFSFDSIGGVYSAISSYLFADWNQCGKVMGLAAYGSENVFNWNIITFENGELNFNSEYRKDLVHPPRTDRDWQQYQKEYENISFTVQLEAENALIFLVNELHERTGSRNLVISGGVGLNCVANQKVQDASPFENVFVPPVCADDGISVGCAYYGWFLNSNGAKTFSLSAPYFGKKYEEDALLTLLSQEPLISFKQVESGRVAARAIRDGRIIGWFHGASEMGPRALGNRSILADPRDPNMKDRLNEKVKHREPFRPYGASVLVDRTEDYFNCPQPRPYTTFAVHVKEEKGPFPRSYTQTARVEFKRFKGLTIPDSIH